MSPTPENKKPLHQREQEQIERERIARELAADRAAAGLPPEQILELTPAQIERAEQEKAALLEAVKPVPKKAGPEAQDGLTQRLAPAQRAVSPRVPTVTITPVSSKVDASEVQKRLDAAADAVKAKLAEITAAEEQDRLAKEARELELDRARQQLGVVEQEQTKLEEQAIGRALTEKAERFEKSAERNRRGASSEESVRRAAFIEAATPLVAAAERFMVELMPWAAEYVPVLQRLSKLRWEDTPGEWLPKYRRYLEDRAVRPSLTLLGDIDSALKEGTHLISMMEQVLDGAAPWGYSQHIDGHRSLLQRLQTYGNHTMKHFRFALGALYSELDKVETAAWQNATPGVRPRVTFMQPLLPQPPGSENVQPAIDWNSDSVLNDERK